MPGYPKLIKDVWGISGPIDTAFTRINCQGKSYIFKVCKVLSQFCHISNEIQINARPMSLCFLNGLGKKKSSLTERYWFVKELRVHQSIFILILTNLVRIYNMFPSLILTK